METFSVQVIKETSSSQLGIELDILPGTNELIVTAISEESPLADADPRFQVGIQILQIDQVNVQGSKYAPPMTPKQVVAVLLSLPTGPVVLQCRGLVATAEKEFPETRVGIALQKNPFLGYVRVFSVSDTGLFAGSGLLVGQRVTAVNGVICPPESLEAITRLKDAEGPISIVTVESSGLLTTSVQKSNLATLVGVKLRQKVSENEEEYEDIHVSDILPGSLIANSGIKIGDKLISINGTPTPDNVYDSVEMMKQTVGNLVLETIPASYGFTTGQLESDTNIPTLQEGQVLALASKDHKSDKVGLLFREVPGENIVVIGDIAKDSMLLNSAIQRGMKIVSINAQMCPPTPKEVVSLLSSLRGPVYIVASYFRAVVVLSPSSHVLPDAPQESSVGAASVEIDTPPAETPAVEAPSDHQVSGNTAASATQLDDSCPPQDPNSTADSSGQPQLPEDAQVQPSKATGLKFGQHKAGVVLQAIEPGSAFQGTDLHVGQVVVSINGKPCPMFATEAQKLVDSITDSLCLEAAHVVPSLVPEWPKICLTTVTLQRNGVDTPIGIKFGRSTLGRTVISSMNKNSPLMKSGMTIGMVVVSVNGEPCPKTPQEALEFVNGATGELKIVVAKTVAIAHTNPGNVVGLGLGRCPDGVVVQEIAMDSIFYQGQLQAGQRLLSINGEACPNDPENATRALDNCSSQIVVEAVDVCDDEEWPSDCRISVDVVKAYASQYVGLRVRELDGNDIIVTHVDKEGLFANSPIQPGMVVISVNGIPCPSSCEELTKMWNQMEGSLEVVVATFVHHIYNPKPENGFGISLKKVNDELVLSKIDPNGAASKVRAMKERQRVIAINGDNSPSDLSDAISCIKADKRNLTLTCLYPVDVLWRDDEELKYTVKKEFVSTPLGLILTDSDQGRVVVGAVCGGVCGDLSIEPGMVVVAINGFSTFNDSNIAMRFLADAIGDVTIILAKTRIVLANVSDLALGLTVVPDPTRGVLIKRCVPNSPFAETKLKVPQRIVSLNGTDVSLDNFEMDMLKQDGDRLVIETVDTFERHWSPTVMYSHSATKQRRSTYVGVEFCTSVQQKLVISRVDEKGIFASSKLVSGQAIISVNGYICTDAVEAAEILSCADGIVTLIVADTYVATKKSTSDESIGVSFSQDDNGVFISKIRSESSLSGISLQLRQRLLSINGKPLPSLVKDVVSLLKSSSGFISMVVRDSVEFNWPIESLTTIVGSRESPEQSYGVLFAAGQIGKVIIGGIKADGAFAASTLRVGHVVLYINDRPVPTSPTEANILMESSEFEASIVVAEINVKCSGSQLLNGLSLTRTARGVEVLNIEDRALLPGSFLPPKALIISINGEACPSTVKETVESLSREENEVTLVAVDTPAARFGWPDECLTDVCVYKDNAEIYIGFELQKSEQGRVVVSWLDCTSGALRDGSVNPGDIVVAINGNIATSVTAATEALVSAVGRVCLVLARTVAIVDKVSQATKIGIKLKAGTVDGVVVHETCGLASSTLLKKGQRVLSINNEPCPNTLAGAIQKIKDTEGVVRIEAIDSFEKSWYTDAALLTTSVDVPDDLGFLGIHLQKSVQGRIVISSVDEQSPFHRFDLTGRILVSINDHASPKNAMEATEMLHSPWKQITLVTARTVAQCSIDPSSPGFVGLSLGQASPESGIVVTKIEDDSPFSGTCLRNGQRVVQISGKPCPPDLASANEALDRAVQEGGTLHIETADELQLPPIGNVTYTVVKPFKESLIGVWLKRNNQNRVAVSQIDPNGLFAKTGLKLGQVVLSVNGMDVSDDVHLTVKQIQRAQRVVSIVARSTVIKVVKPSRDSQVGITLANIGGNVIVKKVFPTGILADTGLDVGQRVVSVNGVEAMDVHGTIQLIRDTEGELKIEAVDGFYEPTSTPEGASHAPLRRNASAWKVAKDTIVGISVKNTPEGVVITKVTSDGLFGNSALQAGQKIVGINGSVCPPTATETVALLRSSVGGLVLSTETTCGGTI